LTYVHADIVKTIQSADGRAKVDFLRRNDGLYEYRGYIERRHRGHLPSLRGFIKR